MYRIKDPKASLAFYTGVLGMYLLKKLDFPEMKFSLYFLGFVDASKIPADETERTRWCFSQVCMYLSFDTYIVLANFSKKLLPKLFIWFLNEVEGEKWLPFARHYNLLLIRNRSRILTIENKEIHTVILEYFNIKE